MPTYKQSAITAKEGINFVRSVVESGGSLFLKIEQENDLGIDAILEFIEDGHPLNKQIAIQVKSGASYYTPEAKECAFPIGTHRTYWSHTRYQFSGSFTYLRYKRPIGSISSITSKKTQRLK